MSFSISLAFLAFFVSISSFVTASAELYSLDIPPRFQWNANNGYCGEVSLISAGLFFGQYCSQYTARSLATGSQKKELLLGINGKYAATAMHLSSNEFYAENPNSLGAWIRKNVLNLRPVITTVFTNERKFYGIKNLNAGDPDYDHIVPVTGFKTSSTGYSSSDILYFSDNGLWAPNPTNPPYTFQSSFSSSRNRRDANRATSPVYSLNKAAQYGLVINGVKDLDGDTIPVGLTTSVNKEVPRMKNGSTKRPKATKITITAIVSIPDQSKDYNLYFYDSFSKVPDSKFNAQAAKAVKMWSIPAGYGATYQEKMDIMSDTVAVFRAVAVSAP